jgi:hypothetical protein
MLPSCEIRRLAVRYKFNYYCRNLVLLFQELKFNNRGNRFLRNQTAGRHIPNTKVFHHQRFSFPTETIGKKGQTEKSEKETCKENDNETWKRIALMFLCEEKLLA